MQREMEIWASVSGYEGFYEVSDHGALRRIATPSGRPKCAIVAPHIKRNGYLDYWLWLKGKVRLVQAHRLVIETFIGPIPDGLCVNHKNGVKSDNRLDNLEVVTPSENIRHGYRVLGRKPPNNPSYGEKNGSAVLNSEKVRSIRSLYATGLTQYQVADAFGVSQRTINLVVRRLTWGHVE